MPIYVTENGYIQLDEDNGTKEDFLEDPERIAYLTEVIRSIRRAIADGIDVRGYYVWSLLDNFEWNAGYTMRYGLYHTDFGTLERTPKKSAGWYRNVIENNGLDV